MSAVVRVAKNSLILLLAQIISYILAFVYTLYIARYLSPNNFGILSFSIALTTIISLVGDIGLSWLFSRDVSRDIKLTRYYLSKIIPAKIILSIIAYVIILLCIFFMGISGDQALVVGIIGISMVLNIFSNIFQAFYQVKERMEYIGLGQLIYAVLLFCGIFGGIAFRFDIKGIALIYAGSSVLTLVFYIIVLICRFPREMPVLNRLDMHDEKRFLFKAFKQCWPVGLAVIFNGVYSWIDTVILSALQNPGEAGLYNASYRMLLTIYIIPGALSYAVFPLMARYYVKDRPMAELTMEKSIKYLFVLGIPIAVATALLAERFILLLYGDSFLSAAVGLRLMIWSIPFYFANVIFNNYFNVANKQTVYTIACILMALISTVLNLLFVPRLGLIAASSIRILTDLSGFIFFISQISLTGYKIKWKSSLLTVIKIIGACVIMALFINFLYNLNLLILMVFSVFIYFISLLALKMLDANDMKIIRQIIFIKW